LIIVDRSQLTLLLKGRALEVPDPDSRYRLGRTYALGVSHRKSVCRVLILGLGDGRMLVRLAAEDKPRLLARDPAGQHTDYVSEPSRAMFAEPEALSAEHLERMMLADARRRRTEILAFRDQVVADVERLAEDMDRASRRRLRNVSRTAQAL
jgi:hypothetical protein